MNLPTWDDLRLTDEDHEAIIAEVMQSDYPMARAFYDAVRKLMAARA